MTGDWFYSPRGAPGLAMRAADAAIVKVNPIQPLKGPVTFFAPPKKVTKTSVVQSAGCRELGSAYTPNFDPKNGALRLKNAVSWDDNGETTPV